MSRKVYNYDTQKVLEVNWYSPRKEDPNRQCVAAGAVVNACSGHISYHCNIPSRVEVGGKKYCWRHKQMLDEGKTVKVFPPGPVT